jgi:serine/threonine-protein kinase
VEDEPRDEHSTVIRDEEVGRARAYGRATAILALIGIVVSAFRQLSWRDRLIVDIPVVFLALIGLLVWWRSRNVATYSRGLFRVFGVASGLCSLALILKLGVFTPIVIIVVIGLTFFLNTADHRFATFVSGAFVAAYVTMGLLTAAGILPDTGIWRTPALQQRLSMTVIVAAVMVMQIIVSLSNRRTLHEAVVRAQEAMRVVRTREAQLDEARENLDVALRGPNAGKHTGELLGGYRLGNTVGRGAMGEVYAARRESDGKRAAIKVLHRVDDDSIRKRFLREADIAKRARGPNLVEVFETGIAPDGSPFIAMELLEGKDLAAILRDETQLALMDVVALVDACAQGLDILHRLGVIHRDMKPQNLFLPTSTRKEWKILDYGVSKIIGARTMTQGDIIGTPGYMSPEQAEGKDVDIRTDIFALGAVAYRALTGRRAFSGPDLPAILYQVVHTAPPRPRELVPDLPRRIDAVLAKALAKKKEDRYASAIDLAIAFREASDRDPDDEIPSVKDPPRRQISSPTLTLPGPNEP